jgi:serine/threonine protein kinase
MGAVVTEAKSEHPSLEQLAAFHLGQLAPAEQADIERHVAECTTCSQELEALPDDSLTRMLRAAVAPPEAAAEPAPSQTHDLSAQAADLSGPSTTPARSEVPAELDAHPRYRILVRLGTGGMGVVFKAEHRLMERLVALKVIHKHLIDRPTSVERFRQEVRAAARLTHPNIVTAYDADQAGEVHFLVMEFVEGQSLDRLLERQRSFSVRQACYLVQQAALGMQHAFERGMVHRDIKPANLLVTPAGQVKVVDFGLARFAQERGPAGDITPSGTVLGTPDYIAPEQALDSRQADIRADIYSLGCTLYHLLAGRPPFSEGTVFYKLMAHRERAPRPMTECRPDLPSGLAAVLERMLAKDPAQRYQTPADVARELAPFVHGPADPQDKTENSPEQKAVNQDLLSPALLHGAAHVPYSAEISRTNPTCFLFLIDQSTSMAGPFGGQPGRTKAEGVADAINRLLQNLALKCAKSDGIRDYFHVGVIGYGQQVQPALGGPLAGRRLVPVSTLANNPLRVEQRTRKIDDGAGGLVEQSFKFPVWFEPVAGGKTPMCQALTDAQRVLREFIARVPGCFPPLVINITDGKANDGDPQPVAAALRELATTDGPVLLFNAHLSSSPGAPVLFPSKEEELADAYARAVFRMSSPLPPRLLDAARSDGFRLTAGARGFVFNADLVSVIRFLDIGTRMAHNVR